MGNAAIGVLIVDDHAVMAESLAEVVGRQPDMQVVGQAGSLAAMFEMLDRACPDVVLLDVRLPDGDGASNAVDVRERCPDAAVVILTASTTVEVLALAVEGGAAGVLSKGEKIQTVLEAVRRAHQGAVLFDAATLAQVAGHLRDRARGPGADLTRREREVLQMLAAGSSTDAIAERFVLSTHTVRNHVRNITMKLGVHSKLEAVAVAFRDGLVELHDP